MKSHPYEIRVAGTLGEGWEQWFAGVSIRHGRDEPGGQPYSVLSGSLDQAALHGILMKIRDLNLPLIAVRRIEQGDSQAS